MTPTNVVNQSSQKDSFAAILLTDMTFWNGVLMLSLTAFTGLLI